jgi:cell surface protein SprA
MNLLLSALSQLKTARTQSGVPLDSVFTTDRLDLPLDFAPEGTRLKIQGTPSLNQIKTIVIGVRHAKDPDATPAPPELRNVELWVNELRVSGYDERTGWATTTNANVSLADLATLQGSFRRQTDGFGSLSSTLDERRQTDNTNWSARAELNLDALLPKQQGWSMPVTMQMQSSRTEPRFDPERGDVRVQEVKDQFDALPDSTIERQFGDQYPDQSVDQIQQTLQDSVEQATQTYSLQRTVTANLSKSGSDSWWMRKTIDGLSLNFSYLNRTGRSPQLSVDEKWSWQGSFDYQIDFGQARTVTPLGFLPEVPVLAALGDVAFNYVPTSLSFSGSANRGVTTTRDRPTRLTGSESRSQPVRIAKPFRENQNFSHNRNFGLQYDPFGFLSLNFRTNTRQTLNDVGGRTQQNLIFASDSPLGKRIFTDVDTSAFLTNPPSEVRQAFPDTSLRDLLGNSLFVEERLRTKSEGQVFRDLFFGDASPRTNSYGQQLSATLRLGITDRKALNWIDLQDISYQSSFDWQNGAKGSFEGASVQNSVTLRTGVSLKPNKVWERFGFFERMKKAQREDDREDESDASDEPPEEEGDREGDADGKDGSEENEDSEEGPSFSDLPLPNPVGLLRGLALTFMDIRDITVNYNGNRSTRSSNVGVLQRNEQGGVTGVSTSYSILDAIRGDGPSLGYRLGFSRSIDPQEKRVFPEGQTVLDNLTNRHRFEARTSLTPSSTFNIDLNWNVSWSNQPQIEFQRPRSGGFPQPGTPGQGANDGGIERFRQESGSGSASVWAFGSYRSFFENQLQKLQNNAESPGRSWASENLALTQSSVDADFRDAFLTGGGSIAGHGFVPFPMPGWTVRYSGLSDWPLVRGITENVSLNHGYSATYETSFNSNTRSGDTTSVPVVGQTFRRIEAGFTPQSTRIQEQYQPLVGIDITWPWDLQTSIEWSRSVTTALRGVDAVVERKTGELSGRVSYSKRGLQLPFFAQIQNRIQLSLTLSRSTSDERTYFLESALQEAAQADFNYDPQAALEGDNVEPRSTTRLTISPEISYSVSNRVTADLRLNYEKFSGENTSQPSFTNINGTFNLSVSISQN